MRKGKFSCEKLTKYQKEPCENNHLNMLMMNDKLYHKITITKPLYTLFWAGIDQ